MKRSVVEGLWEIEIKEHGGCRYNLTVLNEEFNVLVEYGPVRGIVEFPMDNNKSVLLPLFFADGGRGKGGGKGREIVDMIIRVSTKLGYSRMSISDGSVYWDRQSDFNKTDGPFDVTHYRELT